jgi:hypothetical protein
MAIEYIVESLDKVEEGLRSAYTERDGKFHLDPDAYAELKAQGLKRKNAELMSKARLTKTSEEKVIELEAELKHFKLTTPLREIASKAGVLAQYVDLVLLDTQKRFALEDDGRITVLDEYGSPTSMTPEKFFRDIHVNQRPHLYAASNRGGSGAHNNHKSSGGQSHSMTREAFEKLSPGEQMQFSKQPGATLTDA